NPQAESTGTLVYDLISYIMPSAVDERIALAVLTAIVTDTGYFRYSNTNALTHRIAASLYEHGARVGTIRRELETGQPFCRQKLLGMTLSNVRQSRDGNISYAHITSRMFERAGARREHTDGIIDHVRIIHSTWVAALIIQEGPDLFKVSFRTTEQVAANEIASILGGGGHSRAAGATLAGSLERVTSLMLRAAETVIDIGKE
ncbi:MAG: DHH family phosphoesterase, partial [Candidatus Latescibacterota bacterium]